MMKLVQHHLRNAFIPHLGNDYRPHALRRKWLHATTLTVVTVKVLVVVAVSFYAHQAQFSDITPSIIVALTNQARDQRKVATLATNPLLTKAAEAKANDMATKGYFAHISPGGVTPWSWFKQAGYTYSYAGENLALDFISGEDVITGWLNSPSHRANLLSTKYKDIGVAVKTGMINGSDSLIVVQMFGSPVPTPATKKVTVPAQTPLPKMAKDTLAKTPVSKPVQVIVPTPVPTPVVVTIPTQVLGEAAQQPVIPPAVPTVTTPGEGTLVRTSDPQVIGRSEVNSIVTLFVNGIRAGTAVTDASGVYTVTSSTSLPDGDATLQVTATAKNVTSSLSSALKVSIDTEAPSLDIPHSIIVPSYTVPSAYDVAVAANGDPSVVQAHVSGQAVALTRVGETYVGRVQLTNNKVPGVITVSAADQAGNRVQTVLADPEFFTTGVVASTSGPFVTNVKLILFSRVFLVLVLTLLLIIAVVNVAIDWRHLHHPTFVHAMLVVFLIGTLLFV